MAGKPASGTATAIGVVAIALWASLAALTAYTAGIPPFELLALSFGVAFVAGLGMTLWRHRNLRAWHQPWQAWACSFLGIFVYHALYFYALKTAPVAEASLINNLWPLLIVLFASIGSPVGLDKRQILGACMGFAGTALIMASRGLSGFSPQAWSGYAAALACAFTWSTYSVANRRFNHVPSDLIGGVCGLVAVAGGVSHLAWEQTIAPTGGQWLAIAVMGMGPVGLAFYAWDHATKHGQLAVLGVISYFNPLLSTGLLIALGMAEATLPLVLSALLIIAGAAIATSRRSSQNAKQAAVELPVFDQNIVDQNCLVGSPSISSTPLKANSTAP